MNSPRSDLQVAFVLGGTGLVGSELLGLLLQDPRIGHVIHFTRRLGLFRDPKLREVLLRFEGSPQELGDQMEEALQQLDPILFSQGERPSVFYVAFGTTLKKSHGDRRKFFAVDYGIPSQLAARLCRRGVQKFVGVSSIGADPNSSNFYLKTKGQLEREIERQDWSEVHWIRPSFLMGSRKESRPLEKWGSELAYQLRFLLQGPLKKYRPIHAKQVAQKMCEIGSTLHPEVKVKIHEFR